LLQWKQDGAIERLPLSIHNADPRYSLHIDQVIRVADKGIFLCGWLFAERTATVKVACHCGRASYAISDNWIRHSRTDVATYLTSQGIQTDDFEVGFSCYVQLKSNERPFYLSVEAESGEVRRMSAPMPNGAQPALQAVRTVLGSINSEHRDIRVLMDNQIGPAIQELWSARQAPPQRPFEQSFGVRPTDPALSIIVPLYGRYDLAEYQLALFAGDADFQSLELIYVSDDPANFEQFRIACPDLHAIYRVPFSLLSSGTTLGFAGANNFGVRAARGRHLILLNSDVLPKRPGWASDLLRTYKSLESPGMLGAKLLYDDGSLQHAGMAFRRYFPWGDLWINDHPFKGQSPITLRGTKRVDAVTAACALMETELYRELGGFSEDYIIGDFEDSDLCLRAQMAGRTNYVALDVELYHLERQSQNRIGDARLRANLTAYNCWLFNNRFSGVIEDGCAGDRWHVEDRVH
jgi:GT2 family glycosyltransferase